MHNLDLITANHPDGTPREVAAFVDGTFYARGTIAELLYAVHSNPDLAEARFEIDPPHCGVDRKWLIWGQPVTVEQLRAIKNRR